VSSISFDARDTHYSSCIRYPDPHHAPPSSVEAELLPAEKAITAIEEQATVAWASGRRAIAAEDFMVVNVPTHEVDLA